MSGSWVTTITAKYERGTGVYENSESLAGLRVLVEMIADRAPSIVSADWDGLTLTVVDDYGTGSKYDAARPALSALRELFDPIADDEYYRPWPIELSTRTVWVEAETESQGDPA